MTQLELIQKLAANHGITKAEAGRIVDAIAETIINELLDEGKSAFPGLGIFTVKIRAPRTFRNPVSGQPVEKPERKAITFKPLVGVKRLLQSGPGTIGGGTGRLTGVRQEPDF